eukprot:CAMPEP_0202965396 /NCGR_PEP_ID=MMETSP1396-20130829/9381_1 /ASSEMBLY_ACC=CAM_ASM_000872 /TAXON_ID= /ORGANISM="Pseudokeronopsis sp., Strain Brazil" /LENGTH=95 /DNA_ID=CAMNT_0049688087 /DNA_START=786 /DNA_END=1073 /DNA_ORIENTATION=-
MVSLSTGIGINNVENRTEYGGAIKDFIRWNSYGALYTTNSHSRMAPNMLGSQYEMSNFWRFNPESASSIKLDNVDSVNVNKLIAIGEKMKKGKPF